jgi:hypothetical protein
MTFAPQGLWDSARRFNAGEIQSKGTPCMGVRSAIVTMVEYGIGYPFLAPLQGFVV